RKIDPNRKRPFKVPFSPFIPLAGILCCSGLMYCSMQFVKTSRLLFPLWIAMGVVLYFAYGYSQKRKEEAENPLKGEM
ncbi:hypothetical protein IJ670_01550, partial [bacterium]|nr:hypothetical protein [bacterium]